MEKVMLKRIVFLSLCLAFSLSHAAVAEEDLAPLLEKITNRLNSYQNNNWTYKLTTKTYEMDKQWQPNKTSIITARVTDVDGKLSGKLLKAEEIEEGVTNDITSKIAERVEEQLETANKQRAEGGEQERSDDSSEAFLPFSDDKRDRFDFNRLDDSTIDGKSVFTIEAKAKEKDEQLYEGKFYVDKLTYDVLKARISPSKNPKFIKEMEMDIDFEVLPEGRFFRRSSRTKISGKILFKRFRVIAEEEYSDVEILD